MNVGLALAAVVCLVGAGLYWWSAKPKLNELGRLMFAVGLLVTLLQVHGGVLFNIGR